MAFFEPNESLSKLFSKMKEVVKGVPPQPEKVSQTLEEIKNEKANESISAACDQLGLDANQRENDLGPVSGWDKLGTTDNSEDEMAWQKSVITDTGTFTFTIREQPLSNSTQFEEELIIKFIPNKTTEANQEIKKVSVKKVTSDSGDCWCVSQVELVESDTTSIITLDPRKPETRVTVSHSEDSPKEIKTGPITSALESFAKDTAEDPWKFFTSVIEKLNRDTPVTDLLPSQSEQPTDTKNLNDNTVDIKSGDNATEEKTPDIIINSKLSNQLTERFSSTPKDSAYEDYKTSNHYSGELVSILSSRMGFPEDLNSALVSEKINPALYEAKTRNKKSMYPHLGLIYSEGRPAPTVPDNILDTLPDQDHDWKRQPILPMFVTEAISTSRSGFDKTITLTNGARLSIGVNVEVPSKHAGEGRSISNTSCEAPYGNNGPWEKVQIIEIEGFDGRSIKYLVFTTKNPQAEILIRTSQDNPLTSLTNESIEAKRLDVVQQRAVYGNLIEQPFQTLDQITQSNSENPAIKELLGKNIKELTELAQNTIHIFVTQNII